MAKFKKARATHDRRKYCHCTATCTSKINRKNRLRHYRKAGILVDEAPPSVTATESSQEDLNEEQPLPTAISDHSGGDKELDDGYLASDGEVEDDQMDGLGEEVVNNSDQLDQEYDELRMDVDEGSDGETGLGDGDSERGDLDDESLEFDEWKEFDKEAEARSLENLSDSDRLSELDLMLDSDDLAADTHKAEGWTNRMYSFMIQIIQEIKEFSNRKGIFNGRRP